jgi:hypothetical protein
MRAAKLDSPPLPGSNAFAYHRLLLLADAGQRQVRYVL